jgi:hypothetical protein
MRFGLRLLVIEMCLVVAATSCGRTTDTLRMRSAQQLLPVDAATADGGEDASGQSSQDASVAECQTFSLQADAGEKVLSRPALQSTLADIFGEPAVASAQGALALIPDSSNKDFLFDSVGATLSAEHVAAYAAVAEAIAAYTLRNPTRAKALAPCLGLVGSAQFDAECPRSFARDVGRRVYRRSLADDEIKSLMALYDVAKTGPQGPLEGAALMLRAMLQTRSFLYLAQDGAPVKGGEKGVIKLSPTALASKLSFFIWNTGPDAALIDAAEGGKLATAEEIETQTRRMMQDPKARLALRRFFDQWLGLSSGWQPHYSDLFRGDVDVSGIAQSSYDEAQMFLDYVIWQKKGRWADALTSRLAFVKDKELAKIYGVKAKASGEAQLLPDGERAGLLTRVAFLSSTDDAHSPIHRGVALAKRVLCLQIPSAPADAAMTAAANKAAADPHKSFRERAELMTADASCKGCHTLINPLGFAFGTYDGLGRFITDESHVVSGKLVNTTPVDASAAVMFPGSPNGPVTGGAALSEAMAASDQASDCFAEQLFAFRTGRAAGEGDQCIVGNAAAAMNADGGTLAEAVIALAIAPDFGLRKIKVEAP